MKLIFRHIALLALAVVFSQAVTAQEAEHRDTIYFFETWEQMLMNRPVRVIDFPDDLPPEPDEIHFHLEGDSLAHFVNDKYMAAALGDSIWYINSRYLKDRFNLGTMSKQGYLSLFFNEKVAYLFVYYYYSYDGYDTFYYYLDFQNRKVLEVDQKVLRGLLKDYHDLQMRYEGMKDNKKPDIIEDYFLKFIDRASTDAMRPDILDMVDEGEWNTD
jgi:hypothetical protein